MRRPAVRAVRDRDDVGVERGDLLGRRDLAPGGAGVAEVHDVEAERATGDRGPRADRTATRSSPRRSSRRTRASAAGAGAGSIAPPTPRDRVHDRAHALRGGRRSRRLVGRRRRRARRGEPCRPRAEPPAARRRACPPRTTVNVGARSLAAVAEVVGPRRVVELDRLGVADELQAHPDREPRGATVSPGSRVEVGGIGARVRELVGARPRAAAEERARGCAGASQVGHRVRELRAHAAVDRRASGR